MFYCLYLCTLLQPENFTWLLISHYFIFGGFILTLESFNVLLLHVFVIHTLEMVKFISQSRVLEMFLKSEPLLSCISHQVGSHILNSLSNWILNIRVKAILFVLFIGDHFTSNLKRVKLQLWESQNTWFRHCEDIFKLDILDDEPVHTLEMYRGEPRIV